MSCESSPSSNVNVKMPPSSPNLISPTSSIKPYQQMLPTSVAANQRQRAFNKNTQLQQDYKKHMAAAGLTAASPLAIAKTEAYDHDQENYEINEDQENYHTYSKFPSSVSPTADEALNEATDEQNPAAGVNNSRRSITTGLANATNESLANVNKRKKPNMQNFENLDFGDTADELDTDYDNVDEYEQAASSNLDSANLDDEDEGKLAKKSGGQYSAAGVFTDDEGSAVTSANSMDLSGSRFQFPVLTDSNNCLSVPSSVKTQRPRSNSTNKKSHVLAKPSPNQQRKLNPVKNAVSCSLKKYYIFILCREYNS